MLSWFQERQQFINSMGYFCRIFIGKAAHWIALLIICSLAFLVIFNNPVEAFSFPEGEFFTYQSESYLPCPLDVGIGAISRPQEFVTDGIDQVISILNEFLSFVKFSWDKATEKSDNQDGDGYFGESYYFHIFILALCIWLFISVNRTFAILSNKNAQKR